MKILHVIDSGGLYGAEIVLFNLVEYTNKTSHKAIILSIGNSEIKDKPIEIEARKRNLPVYPIRFKDGFNINGIRQIKKVIEELNIDIVHSHGYKGNILLGLLPRSSRKFLIISTLHGWTSTKMFSKIWFNELLEILVLKKIDKVVAVSTNFRKARMLNNLRIKPCFIPNGVPELKFNGSLKDSFPDLYNKCKNKFSLLSIGRLSKEKGYIYLIAALSLLIKKGIDACLVIAGEGDQKDILQSEVKKYNLQTKVHFIGYVESFWRYASDFSVYVIPSLSEGLPMTLLEILQSGVPVLSTNVGEIPNVLDNGKYGVIIPSAKPEKMSEKLCDVYKNPKKYKMIAENARNHVLKHYSIHKTAQLYHNQYEKLLKKISDA